MGVKAAVPAEPNWDQEPRETAPSVAAAESPPAVANPLATAPVPSLDANADKPRQRKTPPTVPPATTLTKAAAPVPPARSAVRVKQTARERERSRPSIPSRRRVALSRQRYAPQSDRTLWKGAQWVDPQHFGPQPHQSGALSYAPQEYNAQLPVGPQFGPYFPYGSRPSRTRRSRTPQYRSPQPFTAVSDDSWQFAPKRMAPRQPTQSFNNPYGWR